MLALEVCLKLSLKKIRVTKFTFGVKLQKRPKKALNSCDVIEQSHLKKKIIKHCKRQVKELI